MKVTIKNCARCGEDHRDLEFRALGRPIEESDGEWKWTHWALCPTNEEPILLRIVDGTDENS